MANKVAWYTPGPNFTLTDPAKRFFEIVILTFLAGGIQAVIAMLTNNPDLIPPEYLVYSGVVVALLSALYKIITNYKDGI